MIAELEKELNSKIEKLQKRLSAGEDILNACKSQMRELKRRVKEYERLKTAVQVTFNSAADGDL